jgi:hypothetical protein
VQWAAQWAALLLWAELIIQLKYCARREFIAAFWPLTLKMTRKIRSCTVHVIMWPTILCYSDPQLH